MNCAEFEILLADYMDGTLPANDRDAFVRHLDSCAACAALAEDARAASRAFATSSGLFFSSGNTPAFTGASRGGTARRTRPCRIRRMLDTSRA